MKRAKSFGEYGGLLLALCFAVVAGVAAGATHSLDQLLGDLRRFIDASSATMLFGVGFPLAVVAWVLGGIFRGYRLAMLSVSVVFLIVWGFARYGHPRTSELVAVLGLTFGVLYIVVKVDTAEARAPRGAVDAPLVDESDDALRRSNTVNVLRLLIESESIRCPRIALVGPVGSGKSTVVNFVARRMVDQGHKVVRFNPWHRGSTISTGESLVRAVEGALRSGGAVSDGFGLRYVVSAFLAKWSLLDAIVGPSGDDVTGAKAHVEELLRTRLEPNRRLVVVVEDLERCAGGVVSDLLMRMHELVDADGLAYLFAFDLHRVERLLQKEASLDQSLLDKVFDHVVSMPVAPAPSLELLWAKFALALKLPEWMADQWPVDASFIPDTPRNVKRFAAYCAAVPRSLLVSEDAWERRMVFYLSLLEFAMPGAISGGGGAGELVVELESYSVRLIMRKNAGLPSPDSLATVEKALDPWGETGKKNVSLFVRASEHAAVNSSARGVSVTDLAGAIQGVPIGPRREVDEALNGAILDLKDPSVLKGILEGEPWKSLSAHDKIDALFRGMNTAVRLSYRTVRATDFEIARAWGDRLVYCVREEAVGTDDPRASVLALQVGFCGLYWGFAEDANLILRWFARSVSARSDVAWEFLGTHESKFVNAIDPLLEAAWMLEVLRVLADAARRRVIDDFGNDAVTPKVGQRAGEEVDRTRRKLLSNHTSGSTVIAWRRVAGKWAEIEERQRVELAFECLQDMASLVQDRRLDKEAILPVSRDMMALVEDVRLSGFAARRFSFLKGVLA